MVNDGPKDDAAPTEDEAAELERLRAERDELRAEVESLEAQPKHATGSAASSRPYSSP